MRFYPKQHPVYGGIDLQARSMDVCLVNHDGEMLLHRTMTAAPAPFLTAVAPSRDGLVGAVECLCTWDGLADLGAEEGLPFVPGHARSMKAMHGGPAKHDKRAAHEMAALLRGGLLPQASGSPADRRAPRDLFRRRTPLRRNRAALLAHGHNPHSHYNGPAIGKNIASQANREGGAARCAAPAGHKHRAVDLARVTSYDPLLPDLALSIVKAATHHDAHPLDLVPTVPGIGTLLRLGLLDAIHDRERFPRVQDCVPSCR